MTPSLSLAELPLTCKALANLVLSKVDAIEGMLPEDGDWEPVCFFHFDREGSPNLEVMPIPFSYFSTSDSKAALATLFASQCERIKERGDSPQVVVFVAAAYTLELDRKKDKDIDETIAEMEVAGVSAHPEAVEVVQVQIFWREGEVWFHRQVSRVPGCRPSLIGPWQNVMVDVAKVRSGLGDAIRPVLHPLT